MLQTLKNAWKTPDLKSKLLFTLLIVILYRLGSAIPVPWVVAGNFSETPMAYAVTMIAGDAFSQAKLFALSVSPYITASIIIQLLTVAIPALERLAKEGEEGKKKINFITRIITMCLAFITSVGYAGIVCSRMSTFASEIATYKATGNAFLDFFGRLPWVNVFVQGRGFEFCVMVACFMAGAAIVMWLAEKINERGIGNGISIILFANIITILPKTFTGFVGVIKDSITAMGAENEDAVLKLVSSIVWILVVAVLLAVLSWVIVWFTESERRIPVQYAKKVVGRKMYGGSSSNLPLKLNMAGVMPVIFANSIVSIPGTLAMIFDAEEKGWLSTLSNGYFNYTKPLYVLLSVVLLFAFAYFYILISFNPTEVANNIRNNGGAIPGIRPGKSTRDYIQKILNRITLIGAVFLCAVSEVPKIIVAAFMTFIDLDVIFPGNPVLEFIKKFYDSGYYMVYGVDDLGRVTQGDHVFVTIAFAGTSILIVVGVILETIRELEAQLTLRNYKGFLD